ncbi:Gmad2 immunoglobulin-like domain-containing protein [Nocardioides sp.]|uniref:Gmad2 immunoglobulin-like domain-containing protein n=1 Tax=Nocardioides sp. TaxID=35761 RepID=UPI002D0BD84E|nr:Gmad2 immunoglobulin-like domain-containing protein [Nocardioides sp.]HSX67448.1 Gmad2 immunoglobulin-like domain-containing protein [Nocardioides sp.]
MTTSNRGPHDDQLARLVRDAADQVQPRPALDAIRARTVATPKESPMSVARTWLLGGLGGAVATAAVIGGVWFATTSGDDDPVVPGPAKTPSGSVSASVDPTPSEPTDTSSPSPTSTDRAPGGTTAVPVYFAGETPRGLGLYREFIRVPEADRVVAAVAHAVLPEGPADPDYRSLWPASTDVTDVTFDGGPDGVITIDLADTALHDRPAGMSEREAQLAIEQLVYTAQGAAKAGRVPVQFFLDGSHTDTVLGVPTSEPLANGPVLETLAHVNLTTPDEGMHTDSDTLEVSGVANSFEANVTVKLQRFEGTHVVFQDFITAEGWMGEKLFPFSKSFDISDVPAGKYILTAMTDDPSGGAEGNGPYTDSKVIEIG